MVGGVGVVAVAVVAVAVGVDAHVGGGVVGVVDSVVVKSAAVDGGVVESAAVDQGGVGLSLPLVEVASVVGAVGVGAVGRVRAGVVVVVEELGVGLGHGGGHAGKEDESLHGVDVLVVTVPCRTEDSTGVPMYSALPM